jgi:hypothetical protein
VLLECPVQAGQPDRWALLEQLDYKELWDLRDPLAQLDRPAQQESQGQPALLEQLEEQELLGQLEWPDQWELQVKCFTANNCV